MNIRKFTKPVQVSLSGLLIASLVVLVGFLGSPVEAAVPVGPIGPVVRALPATVQPGDTFEVEISFEAPVDDFNSLGFHDEAPTTPSDWLTEADKTWCSPEAFTALGGKTDNIAEYSWLGPYTDGTGFTAIYEVTVPAAALPGTYTFPVSDATKAWLTYYIGLDAYKVPVTGDFEVVILPSYDLTLSSTIGGSVTKPGEGPFTYLSGTKVDLVATAAAGYEFLHWNGAPIDGETDSTVTITMSGNYTIEAEFVGITPYLEVAKSVSPSRIGQKDSGLKPEEATLTLTVSGAGDPEGYLTNVVVTDVLPDYINLEDEFTIEPDDTKENPDGTTTLMWNVGDLDTGDHWDVSFDISSDKCGSVLVDVVEDSKVTYDVGEDMGGGFAKIVIGDEEVLFPETDLYVRCPREEVVGAAVLPGPASFSASYLNISPQQALPNQQVEISINISNTGEERGSHSVALYINGSAEQSQTIGVSPGSSKLVVFKVTKLTQGTYQVNVEGVLGQFTVLAPAAAAPAGFGGPLGTGGIIAIVVVVIALVCVLVFGLRRE